MNKENKNQNNFFAKAWTYLKSSKSNFLLFIIALVLLNLVCIRAYKRLDITQSSSYSLSKGSKTAVKSLEKDLSIKVYFSPNLPSQYEQVSQYVKDLLAEYKGAANSHFKYEFEDLSKPEAQREASAYGLQMIQTQELKGNEASVKAVYMGIVFLYDDQTEKIDSLTSSDGLEYAITTMINKITSAANVLTGISGDVTLKLYTNSELEAYRIQGFDKVESVVKDAYETVNKKHQGRILFDKISPSAEELESTAEKYGIQLLDGPNGKGVFGLVLEHEEKFRVIPLQIVPIQFGRAILGYQVSGLEDLDKVIDDNLLRLVNRSNKIGYLCENGELSLNDDQNGAGVYRQIVEDLYELEELNLAKNDIPDDVQTIVINGPKITYSDEVLYKLDQFVLKGGNLVIYADPFNVSQGQMNYVFEPIDTGLEKLLSAWGVELKNDYVKDKNGYTGYHQQYGKLTYYSAPVISEKYIDQKNPITKNLNELMVLETSSLDASKAKEIEGEKLTVLVKTSPESWTVTDDINLMPSPLAPPDEPAKENLESKTVAVLLEGEFKSAFPAKENEGDLKTGGHLAKSIMPGKVFVTGSTKTANPAMLPDDKRDQAVSFVRNVIDYMNGNEDLCLMRTKGLDLRTMTNLNTGFAVFTRYFNQFGIPLLVIIAGLVVTILRNVHRTKIHEKYDPDNSRDIKK